MADPASITTTMESPLLSIPLEVLLQITSHLPTPAYCNVRLTCKHVEQQLHHSFAREFFTKRQFMLSEFSLQALIDISKSRFSSSLNYLIIGLDRPPPLRFGYTNPDMQNAWAHAHADYVTLIASGQDLEMLTEAVSNLKALKTIGLRDFNSRSRWRDSPDNEWKSYGYKTLAAEAGAWPPSPFTNVDTEDEAARIFIILLRTLAKVNAKTENFEVMLRHTTLHDPTFHLPPYLLPSISPVLGGLRTLFLDLNSLRPSPVTLEAYQSHDNTYYYLQKFLAQTSNLEHLRLNFQGDNFRRGCKLQLQWLFQLKDGRDSSDKPNPTPPTDPPTAIDLPNLRQLDLGFLHIKPGVLVDAVRKFESSLKILSLHKVCLVPDGDVQPRDKKSLWPRFFEGLSSSKVELTSLNMSSLTQLPQEQGLRREVTFTDGSPKYVRKWAGIDMKGALKDFTNNVVVAWLHEDSASSNSSDVEEDENSDGENDDVDMDD